jgi:ribose transport system substrate-binding protein
MFRTTVRWLSVVAPVGVAALLAWGAGSAAASARASAASRQLHIVGVVAQSSDPYFISIKCGAEAAAKRLGNVSVSFQGPTAPSEQQELTVFGQIASEKPDGVILGPFSATAFMQPVQQLMHGGIPVFLVDSFLAKNVALGATYTAVTTSGPALATQISKLMGGKGELAIVAFQAADPFEGPRYKGMVRVLAKKDPNIKVLPVQFAQADANKAAQEVSALIAANPSLKAVYATDGPEGQGAAAAIRQSGKTGKIKLVSFDAEPLQVRGLNDGTLQAVYTQAPYVEGYTALTHLVNYLRHAGASKKPVSPGAPYYTPSPLKFITKSNLGTADAQKYIYKTSC